MKSRLFFQLLERMYLHANVNGTIWLFRRLPLLGKHMGDFYRFSAWKKGIDFLQWPFTALKAILKSLFSLFFVLGVLTWVGINLNTLLLRLLPSYSAAVPLDFFFSSGCIFLVYAFFAMGRNRLLESAKDFMEAHRFFHLPGRDLGRVFVILQPLLSFFGRSVVFVGVAIFLHRSWGFALLWSLVLWEVESLAAYLWMHLFDRTGINYATKNLVKLPVLLLILGTPVVFLFTKISLMEGSLPLALILLLPACFAVRKLWARESYGAVMEQMKKNLLEMDEMVENAENSSTRLKDSDLETGKSTTKLRGYAGMNELFFRRHRRMLTKPIQRKSMALLIAAIVILVLLIRHREETLSTWKPLLFAGILPLSYLLYNNAIIIKAMFLNCDRSLLHYPFYRQQEVIRTMFQARYVSLLRAMLLPLLMMEAFFLLCGVVVYPGHFPEFLPHMTLSLTLYFLFSSVYLFLYYLLQPFDQEGSSKSWIYSGIGLGLYILCFYMIYPLLQLPPMPVALASIGVLAVVLFLGYVSVLRFSPSRFRLKQE